MPFPSLSALHGTFASSSPLVTPQQDSSSKSASPSKLARPELYTAWSVADDAKTKASQMSNAAARELEKASAATQAKTGKIELYSGQYYAACVAGGLLACVSWHLILIEGLQRC